MARDDGARMYSRLTAAYWLSRDPSTSLTAAAETQVYSRNCIEVLMSHQQQWMPTWCATKRMLCVYKLPGFRSPSQINLT